MFRRTTSLTLLMFHQKRYELYIESVRKTLGGVGRGDSRRSQKEEPDEIRGGAGGKEAIGKKFGR
ncbi:hypothetical protein LINPERHAP1_LOCUS914 [Linum perenne]